MTCPSRRGGVPPPFLPPGRTTTIARINGSTAPRRPASTARTPARNYRRPGRDGRVAELACPVDRADGCTGNREGVPAEQYARRVQADGSSLQHVAPSSDTHDTHLRGRGSGAQN